MTHQACARLNGVSGLARLGARIRQIGVTGGIILLHICLLGYNRIVQYTTCHG